MSGLAAATFAELLRTHRTAAGLSQARLAELAGLSEQAISTLERGTRRRPRTDTVRALSEALRLSPEQAAHLSAAAGHPTALRPADQPKSTGQALVPRQLPPAVPDFTGRARMLADVVSTLTSAAGQTTPAVTLVALTGMGGIGKTASAVHAAHTVAGSFPDGQLYINLRGYGPGAPLAAADALPQLLRSLGLTGAVIPDDADEAASLYRSLLFGKRVLVLLDNACDADHVLPLLPAGAGSAALVTSRQSLTTLPGLRQVTLTGLPDDEALDLLRKVVGGTRVDDEEPAAKQLVNLAGGLPLGLRLIGARLAARPTWRLSHLVSQLTDERRRLDELGPGQSGVRASIAGSVEYLATSEDELDRRSATALSLFSLPDGPDLSTTVAARLLDDSEHRTELALERLVDLYLLESIAPGRYRLHDLIRSYARERLLRCTSPAERTAAMDRVLQLYVGVAWRSHELTHTDSRRLDLAETRRVAVPVFPDVSSSLAWLDEERPNIVERFRQAAASPDLRGPLLAELALALFGYHESRSRWSEMRMVLREGNAIAQEAGLVRLAAWLEHDTAIPDAEARNPEAALVHLQRSLEMFCSIADPIGEAKCCSSLSHVCERLGRFEEAIDWGHRSLKVSEAVGDEALQGLSHLAFGVLYHRIGKLDLAAASFEKSIAMARASGNLRSLAKRYHGAGEIYRLGQAYEQSKVFQLEAYEIYGRLGDGNGQAECLLSLGAICLAEGDHAAAGRYLQTALPLARSYGNGLREGRILAELGKLSLAQGDKTAAVNYWTDSVALLHDTSPKDEAAVRALLDEALG